MITSPPKDHTRRVLIVDDQPDTTAILTVLFTMLGHDTRSAHRGRHAIRLARDFGPDLILLDIGLPDISGYEVVRALRTNATRPDRVIAAVTGRSQYRDLERAIEAGFDHFIAKPIDVAKLRDLLRATRATNERQKPTASN
jgi:DNA-binding response OmpR family regulator